MFSTSTIAALITGAALAVLIPIAAIIIFKLKNRDARLPSAIVGAVTFVIFALMLEQLLHTVMMPVVSGNAVLYIIYGALAAGIFEETGRLAAYKVVMKNNLTTNNAIMMGLGHGGFECILLIGFSYISLAGSAIMVNNDGLETTINILSAGNTEAAAAVRQQLEALTAYGFGTMAMGIYERLLAMTLHVCLSVLVYHSVTQPGQQMKMYGLAVALHALFDVPAAMYQVGMLNLPVLYIILTIIVAGMIYFTVTLTKKFNNYYGI